MPTPTPKPTPRRTPTTKTPKTSNKTKITVGDWIELPFHCRVGKHGGCRAYSMDEVNSRPLCKARDLNECRYHHIKKRSEQIAQLLKSNEKETDKIRMLRKFIKFTLLKHHLDHAHPLVSRHTAEQAAIRVYRLAIERFPHLRKSIQEKLTSLIARKPGWNKAKIIGKHLTDLIKRSFLSKLPRNYEERELVQMAIEQPN